MGTACCTEMESGKARESRPGTNPVQDACFKESDPLKEPRQPAAAGAAAEARGTAAGEDLAEKQVRAAAKIQANFRGVKARECVSQMRENTIVQSGEDPELRDVELCNVSLQSKPCWMASRPAISPRTLAQFDSKPMRQR
mmetsp:Transcript_40711/g.110056  ORF Transcript_40711/g.110056 Transcript_40711/m.110056 type:complete len:140 (-) Transcript_40711:131-550(-)